MSNHSSMSVFDVVAVDHLTSLQKNTDRVSAPDQLRHHRRRYGTCSPSLNYTKSLPATPKISRKSSPDTLRKSMARHQESLSRAGSPFGSSTRLVAPSPYHAASNRGHLPSTRSNDDIVRSSHRNNDSITKSSHSYNNDNGRSSKRSNDDISRLTSRINDDIPRSSDRINDDIPPSSSRYERMNQRFDRTRFSSQRGPTPFSDRRTPSPDTSKDSTPSRTINRSAVPSNPSDSRSSIDGICSRPAGLHRRATLQPDRRPYQTTYKTAFGHSPLGSKEDNRYKTPYSSDENVDLISTNYPYTDHLYASSTLPRNYRLKSLVEPTCESREVLLGRYPSLCSSRGTTPARTSRDISPLRLSRGVTPVSSYSSVSARTSRHTSPVRSSRGVTPLNSISARTSRHTSPLRSSSGVTLTSRGGTPASSTRSSRRSSPVRSSARSSRKSSPTNSDLMDTSAVISAVGSRLCSSKYITTPGSFGCSVNKKREESTFIEPVRDISPSSSIKSSRKSSLASFPVSNTRSSPVTSLESNNSTSPVTSSGSNRTSSPTSSPVSNNRSLPVSSLEPNRQVSPNSYPVPNSRSSPVTTVGSNRNSPPISCSNSSIYAPVTSIECDRSSSPMSNPRSSNIPLSPTNSQKPEKIIAPTNVLNSIRKTSPTLSNQRESPTNSVISGRNASPEMKSIQSSTSCQARTSLNESEFVIPLGIPPQYELSKESSDMVLCPPNSFPEILESLQSSSRKSPVQISSTKSSQRSSPPPITEPLIPSRCTESSSSRSSRKTSPINYCQRTSPVTEPILDSYSQKSSRRTSPVALKSTKSSRRTSPVREHIQASSSRTSSRRTSPVALKSTKSSRRTSPVREHNHASLSRRSSRRTSPIWVNSTSRTSSRRQSPDSSQQLHRTASNRGYSPVNSSSMRSSRRSSPVRPNKKAYPTVTRELAANSKIPRISSEFIDKLSKDVVDELEDTLSLTKSVHSDSGIGEELVLSGDEKPVKKNNYDFASIDRSQLEKLLRSVTDKKHDDTVEGEVDDDDLHLENSPKPDLVRRQSVIIQGLVMETEELRDKVATLEDELATVPYVEEMQDKLGAFERKLEDSESYVYQLLEENIDMKTEMETLEIEINEAQDHFRDNDAREFKKTKWELETMSKSVRNLQLKLKKAQLKAALLRQEKEELEEKQKEASMWRGAVVVGAVLAAAMWKLKS